MRSWTPSLVLLGLVLLSRPLSAHEPNTSNGEAGEYDSAATAFPVEDPDVSQVVYRTVTCEAPQVWLTFEAPAGFALTVTVGVPQIERLAGYRPSLALLGPGLAQAPADLPLHVPEGLGAVVWPTTDVVEPPTFFEPFSQTTSWMILDVRDYTLSAAGRYYLAAWSPERLTGKLFVTVGLAEDFSGLTGAEIAERVTWVKGWYEKEGFDEPPHRAEEQVCAPEVEHAEDDHDVGGGETTAGDLAADGEDDGLDDGSSGGCVYDTGNPQAGAIWAILLVAMVGVRASRPVGARIRRRG